MEDLRQEFEGEPLKQTQTQEKPPRLPEKLPADNDPGAVPMEKMRKRYPQETASKAVDRRHTYDSTAAKSGITDAGDAGIHGSDRARRTTGNRPTHSRDDMDMLSRTRGISQEQEHNLRCEMDQLRKQLKDANSRADQAERVAETIERKLKTSFEEVATGNDSLAGVVDRLRGENKDLKAELDEARSHIFSLQPYRRDLTPEEVGRDFDDLFNDVSEWVTKLVDPILDNDSKLEEVLVLAKKKPEYTHRIRKMMHNHGDLVNGSMFPETDVDVLIAIVMRFIHENIFQKILYGAQSDIVALLTFIEGSMTTNVEPKRDLFALRTWRAETYNAIICSPDFQRARQPRIKELTLDLAGGLHLFYRSKDSNKFYLSVQDTIIKPAVALHEKLLTSTHHFYLDLNPYIVWNQRQELEMSPDFLENLDKLKCENILQNRKPFVLSKLDPKPTRDELLRDLTNVTTISPGLYLRQVGKGDAIKAPIVVRPQHVLVAWGNEAKRQKFAANSERTLMSHLYYLQREKSERNAESTWAQWRTIAWA